MQGYEKEFEIKRYYVKEWNENTNTIYKNKLKMD